jgi:hypothetical protein
MCYSVWNLIIAHEKYKQEFWNLRNINKTNDKMMYQKRNLKIWEWMKWITSSITFLLIEVDRRNYLIPFPRTNCNKLYANLLKSFILQSLHFLYNKERAYEYFLIYSSSIQITISWYQKVRQCHRITQTRHITPFKTIGKILISVLFSKIWLLFGKFWHLRNIFTFWTGYTTISWFGAVYA